MNVFLVLICPLSHLLHILKRYLVVLYIFVVVALLLFNSLEEVNEKCAEILNTRLKFATNKSSKWKRVKQLSKGISRWPFKTVFDVWYTFFLLIIRKKAKQLNKHESLFFRLETGAVRCFLIVFLAGVANESK